MDNTDTLKQMKRLAGMPLEEAFKMHPAPARIQAVAKGWIRADEQKPVEGGRYWCYVESIGELGKSHYQWNCYYDAQERRFHADSGDRVTHWMPLADPPADC